MNKLYSFWLGPNEMGPNRLRSIKSLSDVTGMDFKLITSEELDSYILKNHPLHPLYEFLTLNHKSDYLRCYFMNFYGGGYADVKPATHSWLNALDKLIYSPDHYAIGYQELSPDDVSNMGGDMRRILQTEYKSLIGNCSFIMKPHTPLTETWYNNLLKHCDHYYKLLIANNYEYPKELKWSNMMGNIFHPISFYYHDKILQSDDLKLVFENYRDDEYNIIRQPF